MTENLRLVGPRTLTSEDTQIVNDFVLTASDNSTWCMTDNAACDNQTLVEDSGDRKYGAVYNWYTATASSGTYTLRTGKAPYSICPKQWRMATGSTGEWYALYNKYGSLAKVMDDPVSLSYSGMKRGDWNGKDSSGYYWTSTAYSYAQAYFTYWNTSAHANSYYDGQKYRGFAVRCIAA